MSEFIPPNNGLVTCTELDYCKRCIARGKESSCSQCADPLTRSIRYVKPDDVLIIAQDRMSVTVQGCTDIHRDAEWVTSRVFGSDNLCPICQTLLPTDIYDELRLYWDPDYSDDNRMMHRESYKARIVSVHEELTEYFLKKYRIPHKYHVVDCMIQELKWLFRDMNLPQ